MHDDLLEVNFIISVHHICLDVITNHRKKVLQSYKEDERKP